MAIANLCTVMRLLKCALTHVLSCGQNSKCQSQRALSWSAESCRVHLASSLRQALYNGFVEKSRSASCVSGRRVRGGLTMQSKSMWPASEMSASEFSCSPTTACGEAGQNGEHIEFAVAVSSMQCRGRSSIEAAACVCAATASKCPPERVLETPPARRAHSDDRIPRQRDSDGPLTAWTMAACRYM
eukprot:6194188-Pleurochrysis_carterae.AAC.12